MHKCFFSVLSFVAAIVIVGCSPTIPEPAPSSSPKLYFSDDSLEVFVSMDKTHPRLTETLQGILDIPSNTVLRVVEKSLKDIGRPPVSTDSIPTELLAYGLVSIRQISENEIRAAFSIPLPSIISILHKHESSNAHGFIYPLFQHSPEIPDTSVYSNLRLLLPCEDVPVPDNPILLPNAPRSYRNGTHRGIDFYANWGSDIRAVADGVIIRADHHYEEVAPEFREALLALTTEVGRTPSDIFEHILVGQSVYIDHGLELIPGYRCISIYAHMSHIDEDILPGTSVLQGQVLGKSGNSGTKPSTLGTRGGSHLHWELILQDAKGEYYLGQGAENIYNLLTRIFAI